jgi:hypothetical protein
VPDVLNDTSVTGVLAEDVLMPGEALVAPLVPDVLITEVSVPVMIDVEILSVLIIARVEVVSSANGKRQNVSSVLLC